MHAQAVTLPCWSQTGSLQNITRWHRHKRGGNYRGGPAHVHAASGRSDRHKYRTTSSFSVSLTLQKETNVMNVCRRFHHTGHADENALAWRRRTHRRQSCRTLKSVGDKLLCKVVNFVPLIHLSCFYHEVHFCLFVYCFMATRKSTGQWYPSAS